MWTNEQFQLMFNRIRVVHTKVEILNMNNVVIDMVEGFVTSGNISISNSNMIRRTLDMTFVAKDKLEIKKDSALWISRRVRVYIGIEDYNGKIHYFNMGIYILGNPTTDVSMSGRFITIHGTDKMQLFCRPLLNDLKFTLDTPIHEAIKGMAALIDEKNLIIEESEHKIPFDQQFAVGSPMDNALRELTNLYMNYHTYYNVDGFLVFEKMKNRLNDLSVWTFVEGMDFTLTRSMSSNYEGIKNHIKVIGKINDETGILPMYEQKIEGYDEPFSIENIGRRPSVISDSKYVDEEQCKTRCEYEIEMCQNMERTFNITTVPIYLINDVNKIIKVTDKGEVYTCQVDSISIPLNYDGMMNITCHEIFV